MPTNPKNPKMVRPSGVMSAAGKVGAKNSPWRKEGAAKLNQPKKEPKK